VRYTTKLKQLLVAKPDIRFFNFFYTLGINDPEGFEKKVRLLENGSGHYSVQSVPIVIFVLNASTLPYLIVILVSTFWLLYFPRY